MIRMAGQSGWRLVKSIMIACALASACAGPAAAQPDLRVQITTDARPTVVFIKFNRVDPISGANAPSFGSGFIVDKSGLVVTARHVVEPWLNQAAAKENPDEEKAQNPLMGFISSIHDPTPIELEYLDGNAVSDVALLRLKFKKEYPVSKVCFVTAIDSGTEILAFGFPFGKEFVPFTGIMSNDDAPDGRWSANINFENGASGGPVFDVRRGRVIGLVKGGLTMTRGTTETAVTSVRYVTPVIRLRTILTDHGVDSDCGATGGPPPAAGQIDLNDKSVQQQEMLRQQEELFTRMKQLFKNSAPPAKPFAIDTLARRYEGQDPGNVGIDASDASYYGVYRIQAGPNLNGFFAFLRRHKPKFADRLAAAGGPDGARRRTAAFVAEWQALSEAPEFTALQLQFIQATDFARLVARLRRPATPEDNGLGLDIAAKPLALQAVMFSIANQYGPATTLPFDALTPLGDLQAKTDAQLIDALFAAKDRVAFYFPKLNSEKFTFLLKQRNEMEKRDALFMLQNN